MLKVIRGWRRKVGILALLLACALTGLFFRSDSTEDSLLFKIRPYFCDISSHRFGIEFGAVQFYGIAGATRSGDLKWNHFSSARTTPLLGVSDARKSSTVFGAIHYLIERTSDYVEYRVVVPHWIIIAFPVVLAAWLLCAVPRHTECSFPPDSINSLERACIQDPRRVTATRWSTMSIIVFVSAACVVAGFLHWRSRPKDVLPPWKEIRQMRAELIQGDSAAEFTVHPEDISSFLSSLAPAKPDRTGILWPLIGSLELTCTNGMMLKIVVMEAGNAIAFSVWQSDSPGESIQYIGGSRSAFERALKTSFDKRTAEKRRSFAL